MSQARIVTDSTAELSSDVVEELGIALVPWRLHIGSEILIDGPALRTTAFYRDMIRKRFSAVAMPPTARQFSDVYARLAQETDDIVVILPSSGLAHVVEVARQARVGLLGRMQLAIVDSQFISRALGVLVVEAAKAAQAGHSGADIVRLVNGMIADTYMAFVVENMDYLRRHGLDPGHTGVVGPSNFKPLLLLEEGQVVRLQRSRNRGTPVERLVEFVAEFERVSEVTLIHSGLAPDVRELKVALGESMPQVLLEDHIYSPVLASIVGPTAMGVVIYDRTH